MQWFGIRWYAFIIISPILLSKQTILIDKLHLQWFHHNYWKKGIYRLKKYFRICRLRIIALSSLYLSSCFFVLPILIALVRHPNFVLTLIGFLFIWAYPLIFWISLALWLSYNFFWFYSWIFCLPPPAVWGVLS
jgi:hypothetical protein